MAEHYGFDETIARRLAGASGPGDNAPEWVRAARALVCLIAGHDCNRAHPYRTGWAICACCDGLFLCAGHVSNG
jgi:hypothetical protein